MQDSNLPKHIIDAVERRWASRLADAAAAWAQRHPLSRAREIHDRNGRRIPVMMHSTGKDDVAAFG